MPRVTAASAYMHLQRGALGIGENHEFHHARAMVFALMQTGVVKHLFVEAYEKEYGRDIKDATEARKSKSRKVYSKILAPLAKLPDFTRINRIPIATTVAQAVKRNIPVHCGDHAYMAASTAKYYGDFQTRHAEIRKIFNKVTQTKEGAPADAIGEHAKGCLLLWGAAHFEDESHPIDKYILNLPYVMMDKQSMHENHLNNLASGYERISAETAKLRDVQSRVRDVRHVYGRPNTGSW